MRIVIIGNSGGGKSTLAKKLASKLNLPVWDVDSILWNEDFEPSSEDSYLSKHKRIIASEKWVFEGLGRRESIQERIDRATNIVLIDLPTWQHYWLAARRQLEWERDRSVAVPGGHSRMPPLRQLFETISSVDRDWMPEIRAMVNSASEGNRATVQTVRHYADLELFEIEC